MKALLTFAFTLMLLPSLFCQVNYEDVIYLKNGGIIRGTIIEQIPNKSIKIEIIGRNILAYNFEEIEKIVKETQNVNNKQNINNKRTVNSNNAEEKIKSEHNTSLVFETGMNISKAKISLNNINDATLKNTIGFNAAFLGDVELSKNFSLGTGVRITTNGNRLITRGTQSGLEYNYETKIVTYYLNFPILFKGYANINNIKLTGLIGPYFGIGLTGIRTSSLNYSNGNVSPNYNSIDIKQITFGIDKNYKNFDFGQCLGASVEYNRIQFTVSYLIGLINATQPNSSSELYNRSLLMSLGYRIIK
jgi:hypothetical protein